MQALNTGDYFSFERNYDALKSKSPYILLNKKNLIEKKL